MQNIIYIIFFLVMGLSGCMTEQTGKSSKPIYQSDAFTMYHNRIEQDSFTARAVNRKHIISDYQSPAKTNYSSLLTFKFAINGKDNEAPSGQDHSMLIKPENGEFTTPLIVFGQKDPESFTNGEPENLSPNTELTIRLDMRPVLNEMKEKGYYTTFSGDKIRSEDFQGVYIAGGSEPFSWDFDNLDKNPDYKLTDENNDGIYEGTFVLNPHNPNGSTEKEWRLNNDISRYPTYSSAQLLIDALYNMSLDETIMLIEDDGTFRTGAKWEGVWTRDISYSVLLAYAYLEPEISKTSLMRKVNRNRIIQDTGSGGAWPVSSDRVVWTLAAWEIYKVTGDEDWLKQSYQIIKNTILDDLEIVYDEKTGMFKGESSFLDWREQTYPDWMDNVDISQSVNLGTNAVYYQVFRILDEMASILNYKEDSVQFGQYADDLKEAFNQQLWNAEKGYYNQYLYGEHYLNESPRAEALGESLSILFGLADQNTSETIAASTPVLPYGISSIYPQIPNQPPYHNNGIWPFVQAYWNWAVSNTSNERALVHGLASLYRPAALFLTNKENFVAENGDFIGTQINSDRQLWSVAGNLAMVYRVYLGMDFQKDKVVFRPFVPESLNGIKEIKGFKYRNAVLDFKIEGFGNEISEFSINGNKLNNHAIPGDLSGKHVVEIKLNNQSRDSEFNLAENKFSPPHPVTTIKNGVLHWDKIDGVVNYRVILDGKAIEETAEIEYHIPEHQYGQYKVLAVDRSGIESFTSEPIEYYPPSNVKILEVENYAEAGDQHLVDYRGNGFVEITKNKAKEIKIPFKVDEEGTYKFTFRYSNGSGPWNTDNKCAIRTLAINGTKTGTLVMAQRGQDEWSNWGYTNSITADLQKGRHVMEVIWEPANENMNVEVNRAMLDQVKIVKIQPGTGTKPKI